MAKKVPMGLEGLFERFSSGFEWGWAEASRRRPVAQSLEPFNDRSFGFVCYSFLTFSGCAPFGCRWFIDLGFSAKFSVFKKGTSRQQDGASTATASTATTTTTTTGSAYANEGAHLHSERLTSDAICIAVAVWCRLAFRLAFCAKSAQNQQRAPYANDSTFCRMAVL